MFRLAVHEVGQFMAKLNDNGTAIGGSFAPGFTKLMSALNLHYTLVWTLDVSEMKGKPNMTSGLYSGALGLVQRQEADMMLWQQMSQVPIDEPFYFGPALRNEEGAIGSKVVVTFNRADVLKSMMCISPTVALFGLVALLLFGTLIALKEGNVKSRWTLNVWRLFRLIFAQANYWPIKSTSQVLIVLVAVTSAFFIAHWKNLMSTDMFASDSSRTIRTIDDVLRNKSLKVLIIKGRPMYEQFEDAPKGTKYNELFLMSNQNEPDFDVTSKIQSDSNLRRARKQSDGILIDTAGVINIMDEIICCRDANEGNFSISEERFLSVHITPVYGKHLSSETHAFLDMRFHQAFESGLTTLIFNNYATSLKSSLDDKGLLDGEMKIALEKCIIRDLQKFIGELQEAHHLDQMSNQALIGLWMMTVAGLAVAALVALLEKLSFKKKSVRKAATNRLFHKRQ